MLFCKLSDKSISKVVTTVSLALMPVSVATEYCQQYPLSPHPKGIKIGEINFPI